MARLIAPLMSFSLEASVSWNTALPAFSLQPRTAASPPLRFQIGDNHRCTFACESERGSASDSTCRAGNDRNFRVQSAHFFLRGQTDSACQTRFEVATLGRSDGRTA